MDQSMVSGGISYELKHLDCGWMMMESSTNERLYMKYADYLQGSEIKEYSSNISVKPEGFILNIGCRLKKEKENEGRPGFMQYTQISHETKYFDTLSDAMIAGENFINQGA